MISLYRHIQTYTADYNEISLYYLSYLMIVILCHACLPDVSIQSSFAVNLFIMILVVSLNTQKIFHEPKRLGLLNQWLIYHDLDEVFISIRILSFWLTYLFPLCCVLGLYSLTIGFDVTQTMTLNGCMILFSLAICFKMSLLSALLTFTNNSPALVIILCFPFCVPLLLLTLSLVKLLSANMPATQCLMMLVALVVLLASSLPMLIRTILSVGWCADY
ncbi:MAG: hypothetical protein CMF46_01540 [Legionellales bacterium]|nr:hypothetical protein [Legionellales bacterium]